MIHVDLIFLSAENLCSDNDPDSDGDGIRDECDNIDNAFCGSGTSPDNELGQCVPDFAQICGEGTHEENLQCVITKVVRLGWDIVRKFLGFN